MGNSWADRKPNQELCSRRVLMHSELQEAKVRIPGIPGASEPSFRTRDRRWMGLDALVRETCAHLEEEGLSVSPVAAKATIQLARFIVQEPIERDTDALVETIVERLRARRVLIPANMALAVLTAYAHVIVVLDVLEINEFA